MTAVSTRSAAGGAPAKYGRALPEGEYARAVALLFAGLASLALGFGLSRAIPRMGHTFFALAISVLLFFGWLLVTSRLVPTKDCPEVVHCMPKLWK